MIEAIKALRDASAYAKFSDADIQSNFNDLLDALDSDLNGENYDPGADVEAATSSLNEAINNSDQEKEAVEVPADEDDDEFAGLGEDDEEDETK